MIKAGKCYCYHCGNVFSEAYYQSATQRVGALLVRPKHSHNVRRYAARAYIPGGTVSENEQVTLESVSNWEKDDGLPDTITVRRKDGKLVEMNRSCPACSGNATMYPTAGKCDTFVVAIVGATGAGKTTWLRAISASGNYARINRLGYSRELVFQTVGVHRGTNLATIDKSEGSSNVLRIVEKETGKLIANVVLVDAAGELYEYFSKPDNRMRRIFQPHGDYTGIDACILFDSARYLEETLTAQDYEEASGKTLAVFNQMVNTLPSSVPVGYVCTHADKLVDKLKKSFCVEDSSGSKLVPVMTKGTFYETTDYSPQQLWPRLNQEDIIVRSLPLAIPTGDRCRGFVVQSCAQKLGPEMRDGKPVIHEDYTKTRNLFDPLLWILYELNLFPPEY